MKFLGDIFFVFKIYDPMASSGFKVTNMPSDIYLIHETFGLKLIEYKNAAGRLISRIVRVC